MTHLMLHVRDSADLEPGANIRYNHGMSSQLHSGRHALRATLDLFDVGLDLMRQNLRRADPLATDAEIQHRLAQWLHHRPGAEFGDCPGRPRDVNDRPK